MLVERCSI